MTNASKGRSAWQGPHDAEVIPPDVASVNVCTDNPVVMSQMVKVPSWAGHGKTENKLRGSSGGIPYGSAHLHSTPESRRVISSER